MAQRPAASIRVSVEKLRQRTAQPSGLLGSWLKIGIQP
jgi:hypothetical protein